MAHGLAAQHAKLGPALSRPRWHSFTLAGKGLRIMAAVCCLDPILYLDTATQRLELDAWR